MLEDGNLANPERTGHRLRRWLAQIKWQFRDHVDVVRWEDVLAIKKALFGLSIIRREDEALTFELYQDLDELVAIIKQRSEMASSTQ